MTPHHEMQAPATSAGSGPVFGPGDFVFLLVLAAALVGVVLSGRFTYREGVALETAKSNAQALVKWAEAVAATAAKDVPLTLALCGEMPGTEPERAATLAPEGQAGALRAQSAASASGGEASAEPTGSPEAVPPAQPPVAATWATCREALFTAGGPLSHLSNPLDTTNPVVGSVCEKRNRAVRGVVFLQKGTAPPPGMPSSVSWDALADEEPLGRGLMLRIQVCDPGGYPIRIGEVKL